MGLAGFPGFAPVELGAYLEIGRGQSPQAISAPPFRAGDLEQCQQWIRAGLDCLAHDRPWDIRLEFAPSYIVRLKPPHIVPRTPVTGALIPLREVVLRDTVPVFLKRLRFCRGPTCGRAFIARKRQEFCSPRCSQAERSRRFVSRHPERARQLRRESYVRRVRRKLGKPNVKVGTRSTRKGLTTNIT